MGQIDQGYDLANDPFATTTDEISEYYHVQSTGFGGNNLGITIPAANFPVNTQNRVFITLPMVINRSDLDGSRPIKIVDTTLGTTMTKVTTAPTGNNYRIPPESSIRRDVIEVSSTKIGNSLDFDYYGEGTVFNANEFNQFRKFLDDVKTITSNYTILDNDGYRNIDIAHTSTTAMITVTLPTVADNNKRVIKIQNTGHGLTYIDGEGSETISLKGSSILGCYLWNEDDYIELRSNGTEWKIEKYDTYLNTGFINCSDWTARVGLGVSQIKVNSTSASTTIQVGSKFKEATSSNTGTVLFVSSGTSYIQAYNCNGSTSSGVFTNARVLTMFSNNATITVNEAGGNNKNVDTDITHNLSLDFIHFDYKFIYNNVNTFTSAVDIYNNLYEGANSGFFGCSLYQNSTNAIRIYTESEGFFISVQGTHNLLDTDDAYYYFALKINI